MNHNNANVINRIFLNEISEIFNQIPTDSPLLISGNTQFFSSGLDLFYCQNLNKKQFKVFITDFQNFLLTIIERTMPTISVINGHAVAGGFLLSCCTDYRFGESRNYKLGMNEKQLGISLPPVPLAILYDVFGNDVHSILDVDVFFTPKTIDKLNYFRKISVNPQADAIEFIQTISNDNTLLKNKKKRSDNISKFLHKNYEPLMKQFLTDWWSDKATRKRIEILAKIGKTSNQNLMETDNSK